MNQRSGKGKGDHSDTRRYYYTVITSDQQTMDAKIGGRENLVKILLEGGNWHLLLSAKTVGVSTARPARRREAG